MDTILVTNIEDIVPVLRCVSRPGSGLHMCVSGSSRKQTAS